MSNCFQPELFGFLRDLEANRIYREAAPLMAFLTAALDLAW